jgi:hypothetical protein
LPSNDRSANLTATRPYLASSVFAKFSSPGLKRTAFL